MIQGSVVNAAAIVAGTAVGLLLRKGIQERYQQTVLAGVAMSVGLIGVTMALKTQNILLVIVSMVLGGLVGEFLDIDARLEKMGAWLTQRLGAQYGNVGQGFVTASLVFCIGAMAVVGSIQDGMTDDAATLYAKATLDGIASAVFASSMGAGVALSAVPVLLYQGGISLAAAAFGATLPTAAVTEMSAVGGLLIVGISMRMLNLGDIRIANLLPAVFVAPLLVLFWPA
ncbi:DUF554 domain-containing protein [Anaeromusa sp.]|jgi:uncharacterized membrane protein YqgA involved in biofilm formation|uniref:DUF554 domain-containing protein n=1 Tax=Anaeromusa sp. TaxID=1872520 RepID=UPI0029C769C1|nr:DUF554 domain-containing protein [Anaeromusa sp.]MEA4835909.1 DUF554 domain-containing protein [Anaeromusa sp.]